MRAEPGLSAQPEIAAARRGGGEIPSEQSMSAALTWGVFFTLKIGKYLVSLITTKTSKYLMSTSWVLTEYSLNTH